MSRAGRKGTTNHGRIIFTYEHEEPKSARRSKRQYQFWKVIKDLKLEELEMLIVKRKDDLKYEKNREEIKVLRTEIKILEDVYRIQKRKRK